MKTLFNYQQNIVDRSPKSCALFMDMGTGKTITSLKIAEKWMCSKILVICLKSKMQDWIDEIEEETYFCKDEYMVINFESVWRNTKALDFTDQETMIIIDESHKIKNPKAKVSQYIRFLGEKTHYKLVLTGTPQNQQYYDYWMQMGFVESPVYNISLKEFESIYVNFITDYQQGHYFRTIDSYNYEDLLKKGINKYSFYKNYESEYNKPFEILEKIKRTSEYIELWSNKVIDGIAAENPMTLRSYLRECCSGFVKDNIYGSNKLKWLEDFLDVDQSRIVIFVNFNKEIEMISDLCKKLKRPYSIYNGEFKDFTNFKNNENGIAIVNYASGATGINDLCISNIGIFYSLPDGDYILFKQAKSRLDRIGQTKQPIFYYLVTDNTIEVPIFRAFKKGDNFTNEMYLNWLREEEN